MPFLFRQVCAFTAQAVRKRAGREHPAHREAIGMAGCRSCSAFGRTGTDAARKRTASALSASAPFDSLIAVFVMAVGGAVFASVLAAVLRSVLLPLPVAVLALILAVLAAVLTVLAVIIL